MPSDYRPGVVRIDLALPVDLHWQLLNYCHDHQVTTGGSRSDRPLQIKAMPTTKAIIQFLELALAKETK